MAQGEIKKKMAAGEDVDALISNGKSHGREWLKGKYSKITGLGSISSTATADDTADPYLIDLTPKIRLELHTEFDAKMNKNITMLLKKLGEANPVLNLDIGDYCPILK